MASLSQSTEVHWFELGSICSVSFSPSNREMVGWLATCGCQEGQLLRHEDTVTDQLLGHVGEGMLAAAFQLSP